MVCCIALEVGGLEGSDRMISGEADLGLRPERSLYMNHPGMKGGGNLADGHQIHMVAESGSCHMDAIREVLTEMAVVDHQMVGRVRFGTSIPGLMIFWSFDVPPIF